MGYSVLKHAVVFFIKEPANDSRDSERQNHRLL